MKKNTYFDVYVWTKEYNHKSSETTSNKSKYNSPYISLEEYNQIKIGMAYSQVVAIIGGEGEAVGEYGNSKMYIWNAEASSGMENVVMTFVNGILQSKVKG